MNPLAGFTDLADSWWTCVFHSTWQSSLVVLLAFAVVWLRRKRSASFLYAVLVVALLKFLVPPIIEIPVFESPVALAPAVETSDATRTNTDETRTDTDAAPTPASIPPSTTPQRATALANAASATNITLPAELPLAQPPSPVVSAPAVSISRHWKALLALLHLTGAALLAFVMAGSYLHLRRLLRAARPADGELSNLANEVAARLRLRRPVAVLLTSAPCAPMATGLFKRRILLPEVLTTLDSDEMRAVLAHELAHHRRLDLAFIWVEHLVTLLWWFNPLVWILVRAIHRKREDCCDDIVLSLGLAANSQYCKTLLHAAKRLHRSFTPRLVFGCASKLHPMGHRITRIMDGAVRRRAALTAGGVVVVALMGLVLLPTFLPVAADAEPTRTDTDETRTDTDVIAGTGGGPVNVLQFDGENDYVLIPPAKPLDLGETFTVSAWVRVEPGCSDEAPVLRRGDARPGYDPYMFGIYRSRMHLGSFRNTSRDHDTAELVIADVDNDWHYWTGVRDADGGRLYLYRDGELVDDAPTGGPLQYSTESMGNEMGAIDQGAWSGGGNWGFFKGAIDQVSVWNVARKPEDIQREMSQGIKSGEPGLAALWTFDEDGQKIYDRSPSKISATLGFSPGPDVNDPARVAVSGEPKDTAAASPSSPNGVIKGVVVNETTEEPVSGAFVAIDHTGDAGGSNLERFNKEGLYVVAQTDSEGRFRLDGVAVRDGHPFYVTAPGFVRHNDSISLTPQRPELALDVQLRPGATIAVALERAAAAPPTDLVFRLTAKDGRQFLAPREDWPAWPYRVEPARDGAFEFSELAPGQFKVEGIQFAPGSITYLGAVETEVAEGETKAVRIGSQPHDTKVTITTTRDPYQLKEQPRTVLTIGPELDLTLPPGYFVHPEDDHLGKILANSIVRHPMISSQDFMQELPADPPAATELSYEVTGLPEGNYTAAVYTMGSYPNFKSLAVYPRWMTFELKDHDAISVRIPWIEPKGPYVDQQRIQSHPAAKIDEEISEHYAGADPEIQEYIRWTASQFGNSGLWFGHDAFAQLTPEEREQKIVYHVEVLSGEYGRQLCRSLAEAGALQDKRLLPGLIKAASYHREMSDYDCRPKWMAVSALGRQDDISAVLTLIPLVDHGNQNTRMWARASLVRLTGQNFNDDKQAWGTWWNDSGNEPKIELSQLKPWVPLDERMAAKPAAPPTTTVAPADVPPESQAVVDALPGELVFKGTYFHRSRGADLSEPSVVWIKKPRDAEFISASYLPAFNATTVAYVSEKDEFRRYEGHYHGRDGRSPSKRFMEMANGMVTVTYEGGEKDGQTETHTVPPGAIFVPNSRPDSYTAHMGFFQLQIPSDEKPGEALCFDWDNSGKGMATYSSRFENAGKEEVAVPAGTFNAHHITETQLTSGDTWFKKRAGHVTDYWVLDNGIVVRILRHREPYELQLLSVETPAELPGQVDKQSAAQAVATDLSGMSDEELRAAVKTDYDACREYRDRHRKSLGYLSERQAERLAYWQEGSKRSIPEAQTLLALCYAYGVGVEQDYSRETELLHQATAQGDAVAMFNLAQSYMTGRGVDQNREEGIKWYQNAVELGDSGAMWHLASYLRQGIGVSKDDAKAVEFLRRSAELGNAHAMLTLGDMLRIGDGVAKNEAEAARLYAKALELGYDPARDRAQVMQAQTTSAPSQDRPPSLTPSAAPQPALVPPESAAVVDSLAGELVFNATYHHRSRGSDFRTPSVLWLKRESGGEVVAAGYLPAFNETTVAYVSPGPAFHRYEVFGHGRGGQPPTKRLMDLGQGTVTIQHEGGEKDGQTETVTAEPDGLFVPNSRPDSYTAHMALFFEALPEESQEVLCYDYGNDGKSMASYTIRLENVGKEEVTVPAGTFTANHVIENHLTFGDTWYKKRPGHITDYWVLDNGVIVRILRHREPYEQQLASFTSEDPLPGVVQLNEGVTPVALGAAPTGNASAAVTVVHKNTNAGMPAVNVYVQGGPNGSIQRSGTTNADGYFTFGELPAGDYTVGCGAPKGYIETGSERVSVADGGKAEITLRLDPGIRISGLVVDLEGNPIAGAKVRARSWNQSGGSFNSGEVETDSGGTYEIAGVPPGGEYRLFGSAEGHYSGYINVQPRGDLDEIDFTLGKGATVSGRAIDNEGSVVRDAQISLMPDWNSWQEKQGEMNVMWGGQTPLDDSGNFTFSDVAPGKYNFHLWVRRDDQSFEQTSVGGPFEVEAGAMLSSVEAVFPAAESERIEGTVRDETGAPVPNVSVDAITYEGVHWGAKTDAEGRYKLVGLGDHTFDIYFFHDVLPDVVLRKVRPGVYDADAIMPHAGKISGVAINDVTGEPVREGSLSIVWHEAEYGFERGYRSEHQSGSIQQDGTFEIDRVLPGTAYFKVSAPGYLELQSPAVTVKAAQTTEPVEARLTPAAIVEGTVLANGQPLDVEQGISVMCLDDPIHEVPAGYIIHDGKYRLDRLPAGTYEIGAWARGRGHMADQKKRITVKAGDVTELNFVLDFPPPLESRMTPSVQLPATASDDASAKRPLKPIARNEDGVVFDRNQVAQELASYDYADLVDTLDPQIAKGEKSNVTGITSDNFASVPLAREVGLKNGDVINTVNGITIDSDQKLMEIFTKFSNASTFRLGITRNGSPQMLTFNLE
jgi:TPR repeat protein/beta-lactamase regulating signal transducer with metallopeptidase domain